MDTVCAFSTEKNKEAPPPYNLFRVIDRFSKPEDVSVPNSSKQLYLSLEQLASDHQLPVRLITTDGAVPLLEKTYC